jgi:hypothetical protein
VSDGAAPRIDPRFDPRFQRGYVPDATTPPSGPGSEPERTPELKPKRALEPEPAQRAQIAEAPVAVAPRQEPGPARRPSIVDADVEQSAFAVFSDEPRPAESSRIEPWFAAGWVVAVIATLVGAGLSWASVSSENYYGPVSQSERWLQIVGWTVAPSLIQAGLVALVAMLVWAGVRHAGRSHGEQS